MSLPFIFGKKKGEEIFITDKELGKMIKSAPLPISSETIKSEIINLATSRELNHLKKQMWKFSRRY